MIEITETAIPGLLIIKPGIYSDTRGYFYESYNEKIYREHGVDFKFVQDNESCSLRNVIRGLHYQLNPHAQTKLLRVLEGEIMDVAVDLRVNSPAYWTWSGLMITAANRIQVLIPKGCAHGFRVLSEKATVLYKCDEFYNPESERGIHFSDPDLNIEWGIDFENVLISEKDNKAPLLKDAEMNFSF